MDKKWWEAEAKRCYASGMHILAHSCEDIANDVKQPLTIEQRAKAELAKREQEVRNNFCRRNSPRLVMTVKPRGE